MIPFCGASDATIRQRQLNKLRRLLASQASNRFQQPRLTKLGNPGKLISIEQFVASTPFTTKQDLIEDQSSHPFFGSNAACPYHHFKRLHQTSGTTSRPLYWLDTAQSWRSILSCWQKIYQASGVEPDDTIFFAFSFGPFLGFWSAYEAASQYGCTTIPAGGMSSESRIRLIIESKSTVLCCTPSYALHLAEVAKEAHLPILDSHVKRILVAGEPGGSIAATRSLIESLWNASVHDHHGMTETGPVSYPCPARKDVLHILEDSYLAEVINPDDLQSLPCNQKEGELVVTTLDRHGSPVLRYRTGDLVQPLAAPCVCGSHHLSLLGGIRGRLDDMHIIRGVNIYPSAIEEIVRRFAGAAEYRVLVDELSSLTDLCLQVELKPDDSAAAIAQTIQRAIRTSMSIRVNVESVAFGSLPRHEMKARRWTSVHSLGLA